MLNKLLHRQIRKTLGDFDSLPEKHKELFNSISESYNFYEKDRRMIERSMELSSDEMIGLYKQLKKETDETIQKSEGNLELKNIELERKNKELEQFAFVASHDLQEPLGTISSFVGLLQQQCHGKLDVVTDKYLTYIFQASDRLNVLIKDLLDHSLIGAKKELEQLDCNKLLADALTNVYKTIKDSSVGIHADGLPVISGYPSEMKQLFQNLIVNAIKFRKEGITPQIYISAQRKDNYWEFAFADNGIGIDPQYNEKIFVIFQRLHTRVKYKGSGIGLSNCKKIVELHNGKIWVDSKPGEGSTFRFTIH